MSRQANNALTLRGRGRPAREPAGSKWTPLDIPTYDGHPSVGHPSVVLAPEGWNGSRYWMAFTPFPDDSRENPSVVASQDGVHWQVPDGLRNPVVGLDDVRRAGYAYGSDPELVLAPDGCLLLYYRPFGGEGNEAIMRTRSWDGVTWSPGEPVLANTAVRHPAGLVSPAVVAGEHGGFTLWTVNGLRLGRRTIERRRSADGLTWGPPERCTIPGRVDPWHIDVAVVGGTHHMLVTDGLRLFHWRSPDGLAWTAAGRPRGLAVGRSGGPGDARGHYRASLVPRPAAGDGRARFDVWVTGEDGSGRNVFTDAWRIGLVRDTDLDAARAWGPSRTGSDPSERPAAGARPARRAGRAPHGLANECRWRWQRIRGRALEHVLVALALLRAGSQGAMRTGGHGCGR